MGIGRPIKKLIPGYLTIRRVVLRGKSWKWAKRGDILLLRVGKSHLSQNTIAQFGFRFKTKTKFMIWGGSEILTWMPELSFHRRPNLYHGRGIRWGGMKIWRKDGKVSTYR